MDKKQQMVMKEDLDWEQIHDFFRPSGKAGFPKIGVRECLEERFSQSNDH